MAVAVGGWGCHLYFSSRGSGWVRRWPLLAEVGLRAVAMAITIALRDLILLSREPGTGEGPEID
jgi:hypothetical protein